MVCIFLVFFEFGVCLYEEKEVIVKIEMLERYIYKFFFKGEWKNQQEEVKEYGKYERVWFNI